MSEPNSEKNGNDNNKEKDISIVFDPNGTAIDTEVDEYKNAEDLNLPEISGDDAWTYDGMVDAYTKKYGEEKLAELLAVFSSGDKGGALGYTLEIDDHWVDTSGVDHDKKIIYLDKDQALSTFTNNEAAEAVHAAVADIAKHIAYQNETFWGSVWRVAKGMGITVLGASEVAIGVVGIVVPEPNTTAAGVVVTAYGASTVGEGITMIFGGNDGEGYNIIEEGFAGIGSLVAAEDGEQLARQVFLVSNIVVSLGGSYKILKVPNQKFIYKGTYTGENFAKYYKEGFTVGRFQLAYPFANKGDKGMTLLNVTNNSNKWFLRINYITQSEKYAKGIAMNGRIISVTNWHRVQNPLEALKVLVKLAVNANR